MIKNVLIALSLLLSLPANSEIIDVGEVTRDTLSGLDWLDLTSTIDTNYDDINWRLENDSSLAGYRLATRQEVNDLFYHISGVNDLVYLGNGYTVDQVAFTTPEATSAIISLFGVTIPANLPHRGATFGQVGDEGYYNEMWGETYIQIQVINQYATDLDSPRVRTNTGLLQQYRDPSSGWFLVKASPVPVPGAFWLFASSILGAVGVTRINKYKSQ